jgi:outer membrane protein assembly factor BamB
MPLRKRDRVVLLGVLLGLCLVAGFGLAHGRLVWRRLWLPWPLPRAEAIAWTGNHAVDARRGKLLWTRREWGYLDDCSLRIDGKIVLVTEGGGLECRDIVEGELIWSRRGTGSSRADTFPLALVGDVLLQAGDGVVCALDSRTGSAYWSVPLDAFQSPSRIFPLRDGFVLHSGTMIAGYRVANGTRLWQKPCRDEAALLDAGSISMTTDDNAVACLRTESGDEVWRAKTPEGARRIQHFAVGRSVVVGSDVSPPRRTGRSSFWTECLDAASGKSMWSTSEGAPLAAALSSDQRVLFLAVGDTPVGGKIVTLDTGTWTEVWSRPLALGGVELLCEEGKVYVGSYYPSSTDVGLECLDVAKGTTVWTADVRGIVTEHFSYRQVIRLLRRDGWIAVIGCAGAGDYVETFDVKTGAAIARWKSAAGIEAESRERR